MMKQIGIPGVRQVIPGLCYAELEQADIIPFGVFDSFNIPKRKFPTIVYNTSDGFSKFGHFVEAYMRSVIEQDHSNQSDPRLSYYKDLLTDDHYALIWKEISEYTHKAFPHSQQVVFDTEFTGNDVAGHPDIVVHTGKSEITIYDVKTTMNFSKMREETVLQLLSYAALARYNGFQVKTICVALPWQRVIIEYDIEAWDHHNFLFMLESEAREIRPRDTGKITIASAVAEAIKTLISDDSEWENMSFIPTISTAPTAPTTPTDVSSTIGYHIHRLDTLYSTFYEFYKKFSEKAACQIFLAGNQGAAKKKFTDDDLLQTADLIEQKGLRTYIHAPYSINLSRPYNQRSLDDKESSSWVVDLLRYQIETGTAYGARGVVVHVGKPGTSDPKKNPPLTTSEAKENMYNSIRKCLDVCSPLCQLLIETPAGQGTELYTDVQELWEFWMGFTDAEHSRLGICVDTCHVFAAGHDPVEYLEFWLERDSTAIGLIHLNDSKHERGCRKDRHAPPGLGHIGAQTLNKVVLLANQYGIPMVME